MSVTPVLAVSSTARLKSPDEDPASTRYDEGASPLAGAIQASCTVLPLMLPVRLVGAAGVVAAAAPAVNRSGRDTWGAQSAGTNGVSAMHDQATIVGSALATPKVEAATADTFGAGPPGVGRVGERSAVQPASVSMQISAAMSRRSVGGTL